MQDPVLEKMQQLIQKYQGQTDQPAAALDLINDEADLPVLTNIVQLGDAIPAAHLASMPTHTSETLAEDLLHDVTGAMQTQFEPMLAAHLQRVLSQTLAQSLPELQHHFQAMIRTSVQNTLARHGMASEHDE